MEGADFFVEDLLDLSNGGDDVMSDAFFHHSAAESSAVTSNSSLSPSFPGSHFSADLCQFPYEDTAELEWLSNFVEESFSSDELHKLQLIPNPTQFHNPTRLPIPNQHPSSSVPAKARSKRSRVAPNDWSTRVLMVTPTPSNAASTSPATSSSDHQTSNPNANAAQKKPSKRRDSGNGNNGMATGGEVRRCLHCAAEKTPQWRTGPMGPKTLCNACGVRYKSGRLVPEYRPAASPTFVSTKHSNSHRKVMELRRQKDFQRQQQQQHFIHHHHHHHHQHQHQSMLMGVSNGGDDYLIHHHLGPDYRQMI